MANSRSFDSDPYAGDDHLDLVVPRLREGEEMPPRPSQNRELTSSQRAYRGRLADEEAQREVGSDILSPQAGLSEEGKANIRSGLERVRAFRAAQAAGEVAVPQQLSLEQVTPEDVVVEDPGRPF